MKSKTAAEVLAFLPIAVRNRVEEVVAALKKTLGAHLQAVVCHGSAVRGGYVADTSDVNLIAVLTQDDPALIEKLGPTLHIARASARVHLKLLRADEIERAADVFPLFFDDVKRHHAVLFGASPFAALVIHDEHKRLRIEQELREARIALREVIAADGAAAAAVAGPLVERLHALRIPLTALLRLRGKDPRDDLARALELAAVRWRVNVAPLFSPERAPHDALRALHDLLDAAVADVDSLESAS